MENNIISKLQQYKGDILPPCGLYAECVQYVAASQRITISDARKECGLFTVNDFITRFMTF